MSKLWRGIKFCLKWLAVMVGIYLAATVFSTFEPGTKVFLALMGLAMSIAYLDNSFKERVSALEFRIEELERRLGRY